MEEKLFPDEKKEKEDKDAQGPLGKDNQTDEEGPLGKDEQPKEETKEEKLTEEKKQEEIKETKEEEKQKVPIVGVRTTSGREHIAIDLLQTKIKNENIPIKSIFHPEEIKGYIFMEGSPGSVKEAIENARHVRGIVDPDVGLDQIERFLVPEKQEIKVAVGDTVEIIGGPFKGEKAKITRTDETNKEVTVELLEAAIPIPVTISINSIRLYEKGEGNE